LHDCNRVSGPVAACSDINLYAIVQEDALSYINIVNFSNRIFSNSFALQVVDRYTALLVAANQQAFSRIGRIYPYGRVVGCIISIATGSVSTSAVTPMKFTFC